MERTELLKVLETAAAERGCTVADLAFDEDDNVFDVTITKADGAVNLGDCEYVHRAVLAAFDRDVEDYALTVGSAGISGAEADALLKEMEDKD
jgi:ribosome maturation factor RimP